MFNLVKWAFNLGQQTERHRVANLIEAQRSYIRYNPVADSLFGKKELDEKDRHNIELEQAVNHRVDGIIESITRTTAADEKRYSLLFPKGMK